MKLTMRSSHEVAQDLPDQDDKIKTGGMGDCVSIIVLWAWDAYGHARRMRGFHGLGGISAVNWVSLFNNVPNNPNVRVYILFGPVNAQQDYSLEQAMFEVRRRAPLASVSIYHGVGSATVDRSGDVIEYTGDPREMPVYGGHHEFKDRPASHTKAVYLEDAFPNWERRFLKNRPDGQ